MSERRKVLLGTTALPDLISIDFSALQAEAARDEYQIAVDNLSSEERAELRALVPWFRKTVFIICHTLKQTPADKHIELQELTFTFPNVPSPAVQKLLTDTISEEVARIVTEHNARMELLSVPSNSVRIH